MKNHYVAAGTFLLLVFGGGGYLIWQGIQAQSHDEREEVTAVLQNAVEYGQYGRYAEAAQILESAAEKYPGYSAVWLNLGIAQRAQGNLTSAQTSFEHALKANAKDWDAIAELATVQKLQGREAKAFSSLERVPAGRGRVKERLEIDPAWSAAQDGARLTALREKHGVSAKENAALRPLQDMEARRREFQRANASATQEPAEPDSAP